MPLLKEKFAEHVYNEIMEIEYGIQVCSITQYADKETIYLDSVLEDAKVDCKNPIPEQKEKSTTVCCSL